MYLGICREKEAIKSSVDCYTPSDVVDFDSSEDTTVSGERIKITRLVRRVVKCYKLFLSVVLISVEGESIWMK